MHRPGSRVESRVTKTRGWIPRALAAVAAGSVLVVGVSACSSPNSTPEGAVEAYYSALHDGNFGAACDLLAPKIREHHTNEGGTCEDYLEEHISTKDRATLTNIKIRTDEIDSKANPVSFRGCDILINGRPSDDGETLVQHDGVWLIRERNQQVISEMPACPEPDAAVTA